MSVAATEPHQRDSPRRGAPLTAGLPADHGHERPCARELQRRLELALEAADERALARLSDAETSVMFEVVGMRGGAVTLLLGRNRTCVTLGAERAEIVIRMDEKLLLDVARGAVVMSTCLMRGRALAQGPVLSYLAVDPILRALLRRIDEGLRDG